MLIVYLQQRY